VAHAPPHVRLALPSLFTIAAVTLIRGGVHLFEKTAKPSLSEGEPTFTPRLLSNQREALLEAAPLKIGLLMVADAKAQFEYARTIASMRNYTASHGYALLVWDPDASHYVNQEVCGEFEQLFFKRHYYAMLV
jgi:hypothetical protein